MKGQYRAFSASLIIIAFLFLINALTTPGDWWALNPSLFLMLGPLALLLNRQNGYIYYSFAMTISIIIVLFIINLIETPQYLWIMYAWLPILWWPLSAIAGKAAGKPLFSSLAAFSIIVYYIVLNIYMEPGFPWVIFPAFLLLWWPLSVTFARRHSLFSILGTLLTATFFLSVNAITTPETIWALYPIFAVIWWPVSIRFSKKPFAFSVVGTLLLSLFFIATNTLTSPQTIWAVYPIFAILWWPLSLYFFYYKKKAAH